MEDKPQKDQEEVKTFIDSSIDPKAVNQSKLPDTEELKSKLSNLKAQKEDDLINFYKIVVETRKFEIENFWRRALFFWGTLAAIIVGYASVKGESYQLPIFLCYLGLFYNIIYSLSLRGSKFWQEHWESIAKLFENYLNLPIFSAKPELVRKVRAIDGAITTQR